MSGGARVRTSQKLYLCCEQPLSMFLSPPEFVSVPFSWLSFLCRPRPGFMEQGHYEKLLGMKEAFLREMQEDWHRGSGFWCEETPKQSLARGSDLIREKIEGLFKS